MNNHAIFILSLTKSRFNTIKNKFTTKLPIFHIQGIIASTEDRRKMCNFKCKHFATNALIGIGLAHRQMWKLAQNFDKVLIVEDDIEVTDEFDENKILNLLDSFDLVVFGNILSGKETHSFFDRLIYFIFSSGNYIESGKLYSIKMLWGTHGYAINKQTAYSLQQELQLITGHVDYEIATICKKNIITSTGIRPSLVFQNDFCSSAQSICTIQQGGIDSIPFKYCFNFHLFQIFNQPCSFKTLSYGVGVFIGIIFLLKEF